MLNKAIEALTTYFTDKHYTDKQIADGIAEATEMYTAGWDALEDGRVVNHQSNYVMVKKGDSIVVQEMIKNQWHINCGTLTGDVKKIVGTKPVDTAEKKAAGVAQAIVTRFYTVPKM